MAEIFFREGTLDDANKRRHSRFENHLDVEFKAGGKAWRGHLGDASLNGLFIHTVEVLEEGTAIEITIFLSDKRRSRIKGIVRRALKDQPFDKLGFGVEITRKDPLYLKMLSNTLSDRRKKTASSDIITSLIHAHEALVHVLIKKGVISKEELIAEVKSMDAQNPED